MLARQELGKSCIETPWLINSASAQMHCSVSMVLRSKAIHAR